MGQQNELALPNLLERVYNADNKLAATEKYRRPLTCTAQINYFVINPYGKVIRMKRRVEGWRDVDEFTEKILALLEEYNCEIYLDEDVGICVADKDNKEMEVLVNLDNLAGL